VGQWLECVGVRVIGKSSRLVRLVKEVKQSGILGVSAGYMVALVLRRCGSVFMCNSIIRLSGYVGCEVLNRSEQSGILLCLVCLSMYRVLLCISISVVSV